MEADAGNVATVSSNSNSNCGSNPGVNQDSQPQQEGHVTSFSQSENIGKMVQSPDVASSKLEPCFIKYIHTIVFSGEK